MLPGERENQGSREDDERSENEKKTQTVVESCMQPLESLPFIEWKQKGQWKRKAEDGQEVINDESRYTTESETVIIAKAFMRKTIKESRKDTENEEKEK